MAWMTPPIPEVMLESRSTATRVTLGAICLSSSSHFPLILYSNAMNPVVLPPGCAKLFTKPAPTGSATAANTTIPIVFNTAGDPVQMGLVASLNRPGGNVTGVANLHMQLAALLDQP